jgi:hypothetical protein
MASATLSSLIGSNAASKCEGCASSVNSGPPRAESGQISCAVFRARR